ncbi:MAG TPA: VOC family protein [Chloroflexota bacterium]|nr:VOC family protein [Chloroflexota bacterium]
MAKIRHIAIRTEDTEALAQFFQDVFGLQLVQRRGHGPIDLTDGDVNITLLPMRVGLGPDDPVRQGFDHIGFTVENDEETRQRLLAAGAKELHPVQLGNVYYESKFQHPIGLVIDVGHWAGTSPIPQAAGTAATE